MSYKHSEFGILSLVSIDNKYLVIHNENNKKRKMSRCAYPEHIIQSKLNKAISLIGTNITTITSQNNNEWSEDEWFVDITISP